MEKFSLQHTVLYAKQWYKRYNPKGKNKTLWDDLANVLGADGYVGTLIGDSEIQLKNRITYLLVSQMERIPLTGHARTLSEFYESIKDHNCWKYGYVTKTNCCHEEDINASPDYEYNEAVARYCLSEFQSLDKDQWTPTSPNPKVLPLKNGITIKKINYHFNVKKS